MQITKGFTAKIPTVQYGNVDISIQMSNTFDTSSDPKEMLKEINLQGKILDKALEMEYNKTYQMLQSQVDKLTTLT